MTLPWRRAFAVNLLLLATVSASVAQPKPDVLQKGFEDPPQSARPWVWWHWMNGNISKEGIRLDLEWMHRVGLAGFQVFDANLATPQVVDKRLAYMSPEWKDAFRYATTLADRLGLQETIAGSPGWSETGGPWVPPAEAMKKYVWSETPAEGGKAFRGKLIHPPDISGPFQELATSRTNGYPEPRLYAESAVVAYRRPAAAELPQPIVSWSSGNPDASLLTDHNLGTAATLPAASKPGDKAWVQYAFPRDVTLRSFTLACKADPDSEGAFEASEDGSSFHQLAVVPKRGTAQQTLAFAATTARYFRLTFVTPSDVDANGNRLPPSADKITIATLELHADAQVNRFEDKAAFAPVADLSAYPTPEVSDDETIHRQDVIDLTNHLQPDGTLDWTPPPGDWVILRIGYSLLGVTNHPATSEATGLEVDKLNSIYVKHYVDRYLSTFKEMVGASWMGRRGIRSVITDSWEAGAQNWTDDMLRQFTIRRGYDPHPWLPVLAGHIVESAKASDQFLWDLRKTISGLTAEAHYGQVAASLKEWGLEHYGESHESGRALIADGMEVKKLDDVPMSAMWTQKVGVNEPLYSYNADDRESASVGHIYGKNIAAAESMTARYDAWAWSPASLKPTADQELLNGINRIVIHESTHQPLVNSPPGLTLGKYGQWFNRYETWAEEAAPWVTYLARSSYMLQQGQFVADILYFYGEDTNLTALFAKAAPQIPPGYGFDYVNADALIHELSIANGVIHTAHGMRYRILALDPNSRQMSLPVLRAIYQLVKQGGIVVGQKPIDTPSLGDNASEWTRLNNEVFGSGVGSQHLGAGTVYSTTDVASALKVLHVLPDFEAKSPGGERVEFVHRRMAEGEVYFLNNRSSQDFSGDVTFRTSGRVPEIWSAETGHVEPSSYTIADRRTTVPLHLEPWGSVFVVFRRAAARPSRVLPLKHVAEVATLDGEWKLDLQPDRGAPATLRLSRLASWSESSNPGLRFYSGTGLYTQTLNLPARMKGPSEKLWLDLGDVRNLASVLVNGKRVGTAWHAPYRVDVTGALKPGSNLIQIQVINSWVNRLIGDQQPDAAKKYTSADIAPYKADSPLQPSGLLGPVRLLKESYGALNASH